MLFSIGGGFREAPLKVVLADLYAKAGAKGLTDREATFLLGAHPSSVRRARLGLVREGVLMFTGMERLDSTTHQWNGIYAVSEVEPVELQEVA